MPVCKECQITVRTNETACPVCGAALEQSDEPVCLQAKNNYPNLNSQLATYSLMRRLLKSCTVFLCLFSVLLNILLTPSLWWSLLVLGGALYAWILIPAWMRKRANVVRLLVFQVVLTGVATVLVDFVTGYKAWSMDYVVPSLFIAGIAGSCLFVILNYRHWSKYVFYQVLICALGFLPLIFYFFGLSNNLPLVLISFGFGLAGLVSTVFLADKSIKDEFVKRFHL